MNGYGYVNDDDDDDDGDDDDEIGPDAKFFLLATQ